MMKIACVILMMVCSIAAFAKEKETIQIEVVGTDAWQRDVHQDISTALDIHFFDLRRAAHDELKPRLHIFPHQGLNCGFRPLGVINRHS